MSNDGSASQKVDVPEKPDFYSRFRFCRPVGQCARSIFYLAHDNVTESKVIIKQYLSRDEEDAEDIKASFEDEVHLLNKLRKKDLISFFHHHTSQGKYFLVVDAQAASEWLCTHISKDVFEKAIKE